jgi:hypothetical protein
MESSYVSGNVFINLSEQRNSAALVADGVIDQNEILSMSLMYQGSETTVGQLLEATEGDINISVYHGDIQGTENLEIANMSTYGAKSSGTNGITQEELCNKFLEDMIWDELEKQLKETASQANDAFSYDQNI